MTTYELISIISLTFTAVIAVSTFLVPLFVNQRNMRRQERQEELNRIDKENTERIESIFKEQFEIINDLNVSYGNWKITKNNQLFNEVIFKTMSNVDLWVREDLLKLSDAIIKDINVEKEFDNCMDSIKSFLKIEDSWTAPRELTSIKLKRNIYSNYKNIK